MNNIAKSAVILLVSSFLGCGGGGGSSSPPRESPNNPPEICTETSVYHCPASVWGDPFGIALVFAWYSGQCTEEVGCVDDLPQTNTEEGIVSDDFIQENWVSTSVTDTEPNNDFSTAHPVIIGAQSGFLMTEALDVATDPADFVIFAIDIDATPIIYLCRTVDVCLQPWYSGDEIYLDLYDQNEVLISSTETNIAEHFITVGLTPGLQYYVAVRARAGTLNFPYKLVITD